MLNVPFFTLCLDLLTYAKQTNHQETKKRKEKQQKTENVINSDLILGLKGDLANKTNALTKGERLKWLQTMRNTKSVAFTHVSLTRTQTHASRVAHIAVKDKGSTVVFLSGSGMERKKKRKKEGEREQLLVGVDRAAPAPHRRITLERTHHLCSFVELSHFNPWPGPFGNQLHTQHRAPQQSPPPPPPVMQPCSCQHFHLCAAVV